MTPTTRQQTQEQDQALQAATEKMATPQDAKSAQKLPLRSRDEGDAPTADEALPSSSMGATPSAKPMANLVVFGDDDNDIPVSELTPSKRAQREEQTHNEEEESDDDAAPEAVSTHQAAADLKRSSQAAQKVAQQQEAQQKRKRQQKDALYKQQAAERQQAVEERRPQGGRRRAEKLVIPDVLPAELLTDSASEDEEDGITRSLGSANPKRRKVATVERNLVRLDKAPKDEIIGSTVYRIARQEDERMPPKARKHAKSSKALLLKRGRAGVNPKGGFYTKQR